MLEFKKKKKKKKERKKERKKKKKKKDFAFQLAPMLKRHVLVIMLSL
jgi:hypothetical protein